MLQPRSYTIPHAGGWSDAPKSLESGNPVPCDLQCLDSQLKAYHTLMHANTTSPDLGSFNWFFVVAVSKVCR